MIEKQWCENIYLSDVKPTFYIYRQRSIFHLFSTLLSSQYLKSQLNCRIRFIHGHRCTVLHLSKLSILNEANVKVINLMRLRSIGKRERTKLIKKKGEEETRKSSFSSLRLNSVRKREKGTSSYVHLERKRKRWERSISLSLFLIFLLWTKTQLWPSSWSFLLCSIFISIFN
jgi:hypothetical protein